MILRIAALVIICLLNSGCIAAAAGAGAAYLVSKPSKPSVTTTTCTNAPGSNTCSTVNS